MTTKKRTLLVLLALFAVLLATGTAYADWVDCDGFKCWIEADKDTTVISGRAAGIQKR